MMYLIHGNISQEKIAYNSKQSLGYFMKMKIIPNNSYKLTIFRYLYQLISWSIKIVVFPAVFVAIISFIELDNSTGDNLISQTVIMYGILFLIIERVSVDFMSSILEKYKTNSFYNQMPKFMEILSQINLSDGNSIGFQTLVYIFDELISISVLNSYNFGDILFLASFCFLIPLTMICNLAFIYLVSKGIIMENWNIENENILCNKRLRQLNFYMCYLIAKNDNNKNVTMWNFLKYFFKSKMQRDTKYWIILLSHIFVLFLIIMSLQYAVYHMEVKYKKFNNLGDILSKKQNENSEGFHVIGNIFYALILFPIMMSSSILDWIANIYGSYFFIALSQKKPEGIQDEIQIEVRNIEESIGNVNNCFTIISPDRIKQSFQKYNHTGRQQSIINDYQRKINANSFFSSPLMHPLPISYVYTKNISLNTMLILFIFTIIMKYELHKSFPIDFMMGIREYIKFKYLSHFFYKALSNVVIRQDINQEEISGHIRGMKISFKKMFYDGILFNKKKQQFEKKRRNILQDTQFSFIDDNVRLHGPSGSGKSSLVISSLGLNNNRTEDQSTYVDNFDMEHKNVSSDKIRSSILFLPQHIKNIPNDYTLVQVADFLGYKDDINIIKKIMKYIGLEEIEISRSFGNISGGQQRRYIFVVQYAKFLLKSDIRMSIIDELKGLDMMTRDKFITLIIMFPFVKSLITKYKNKNSIIQYKAAEQLIEMESEENFMNCLVISHTRFGNYTKNVFQNDSKITSSKKISQTISRVKL